MTSFYIHDAETGAPLFYSSRPLDTLTKLLALAPPVGKTACMLSIDNAVLFSIGQDSTSFKVDTETVSLLLKLLVVCVEQSHYMPPDVVAARQMEERVRSLEYRHGEDQKQISDIHRLLWEWVDDDDKSVIDGLARLLRQHKSTAEARLKCADDVRELKAKCDRLERKIELLEHEGLTAREVEVLALMAQGMTNKQIGAQLHIEVPTVKSHSTSIFRKFNFPVNEGSRILAMRRYLKDEQIYAGVET